MKPKAKTKSRRVWATIMTNGTVRSAWLNRDSALASCHFGAGDVVIPATLTWTPPAKAKKRSAKR